jgi:hypothetical protein
MQEELISSIPATLGIGSLSELAADFPLVFHLPLHDEKFRQEGNGLAVIGRWRQGHGGAPNAVSRYESDRTCHL